MLTVFHSLTIHSAVTDEKELLSKIENNNLEKPEISKTYKGLNKNIKE